MLILSESPWMFCDIINYCVINTVNMHNAGLRVPSMKLLHQQLPWRQRLPMTRTTTLNCLVLTTTSTQWMKPRRNWNKNDSRPMKPRKLPVSDTHTCMTDTHAHTHTHKNDLWSIKPCQADSDEITYLQGHPLDLHKTNQRPFGFSFFLKTLSCQLVVRSW